MDKGAVFVATCLAAAFGSAFMGLYANYPVALAPGMGLNAYFTYGVVKGLGHSWETALGAVFLSGILFLIVSLTPIREWVINSIPKSLKLSIAAGIGLFLAIIGLQSAGIVKAHPATLVTLGDLEVADRGCWPRSGFILMAALDTRRVPGAILIGILAAAIAGVAARPEHVRRRRLAAAVHRPGVPQARRRQGAGDRPHRHRLHVLLRRRVRQHRHAGRRGPQGGARQSRRHAAARQARADRRLDGRHGRRRARHVDHHQLHRERRRRERRRAHRTRGRHGGGAVPGRPVLCAAGRRHPRVRDGARARLRRLPDDERRDARSISPTPPNSCRPWS